MVLNFEIQTEKLGGLMADCCLEQYEYSGADFSKSLKLDMVLKGLDCRVPSCLLDLREFLMETPQANMR